MAFLVITNGIAQRCEDATKTAQTLFPPWEWSAPRKQINDLMAGDELRFGQSSVIRLSDVVRIHKA